MRALGALFNALVPFVGLGLSHNGVYFYVSDY
jgi:hypothetical protein